MRALVPLASQNTVRVGFPVAANISRIKAGLHTTVSANLPLLNPVALHNNWNSASSEWLSGWNTPVLKDINEDTAFNMGDVAACLNGLVSPMGMVPSSLVMNDPCSVVTDVVEWEALNRNARRPKRANHGKRPCSHVRRRSKRVK